jgi:hypothetical protein
MQLNFIHLNNTSMKKCKYLLFALSMLVVMFSCKKEVYTEQDALQSLENKTINELKRDSLNHVAGIISYTVQVVPASDKSFLKVVTASDKSLLKSAGGSFENDSAYVTVSQWGKTITKRVDKTGMASFEDMRVGTVSVSVNSTNFTSVDYTAELIPERDSVTLVFYNTIRYASTMVPVFSLKDNLATIKGQVTYENDLTNKTPEIAKNVEIIGIIDVADAATFSDVYLPYNGTSTKYNNISSRDNIKIYYSNYTGQIRQMAYGNLAFRTTTDSVGNYSLKVPSSVQGLSIKLGVSEFADDQKLLLNTLNNEQVAGLKTIRTFFSSQIRGGGTTPSDIPWVPGAYISFASPTGAVNLQPVTPATATAEIGESGIASISVTSTGAGYTQAPILTIPKGTGYNAIAAEAVATISNGKITGVTITNPGQGYTATDAPTITVKDVLVTATNPTPVFSYGIVDFSLSSTTGHGLQTAPSVTITSTKGSGATAEAVLSGYVSSVILNNGGTGYTEAPTVVFSSPSAGLTGATGTAVMSTSNSIFSIAALSALTNAPATYWYETTPNVTITGTGNVGSGATAVAELKTSGRIERINLTNAGSGYDAANPPTVTISGGGGFAAAAYATVTAGQVTVVLTANGQGYTSNPIVTIGAPGAGGTQAVATAVRSFQVDKITLTNGGSGYNTTGAGLSNVGITLTTSTQTDNLTLGTHVSPYPSMSITSITVATPGSGYVSKPTINIVPKNGHGSGATASSVLLYNLADIKINAEGSGYVDPADVKVSIEATSGTFTTLPIATAILGKGILTDIQLPYGSGGDGYTASPLVTFNAPAGVPVKHARVTANVSGGAVTSFTIDDPGAGYPYSAGYTATISTNLLSGGFSTSVNKKSGQIVALNITDPGAGYVVAPYVEIIYNGSSTNPNGTTATATAKITDGRVTDITITNPGSGYYSTPSITFVIPTNAAQAKGYANFDANGSIISIGLIDENGNTAAVSGFGYITAPEITIKPTITGLGSNASAIAKIAGGRVVGATIVNKGSGYVARNTPGASTYTKTPTYNSAYNLFNYTSDAGIGFTVLPIAAGTFDSDNNFNVVIATAAKSYVRDIYLGTGKRSTDGKDN